MACRRWHLVQCGSLAFATSVVDAPHRIETPARLLFRGIPVRAVQLRPSRPEDRPRRFRTPLLGFIDRPSVDTPSCVVTRPDRRLDFGPGLPRPDRVPLLPFLPASAVCYAASRSEDPLVRWSAGLLHPAADHGVRHVSDSLTRPRSRASDPKVVDPKVHPGIVPCGEDPSKRSPPRQPSTMPSPRLVLSDAVAFTGWRSLSPLEPHSPACHHAAPHCSRPQGFLPPRSPLRSWDVAVPRPLDAPLGFGSTRSDAAARFALPSSRWTFRLAARTASASPHPNVKGRQGVSALSGSLRPTSGCPRRDDRARSRWLRRVSRRSRLGRIPDGPRRGCQWILPRREVHRVGPHTRRHSVSDVIATHLRRDSFATQRSLRRAAAGGSSSFPPSFRGCPRT